MRRLSKFAAALGIAVGVAVLLITLFVFLVVPSAWFQNLVRQRIISAAEQATGGVVQLQSFHFDIGTLTATASGFVLHGTEPAGSPPLFEAPSITVQLKLFTTRAIDLAYLGVDRPSVHIMVFPDGRTNIPSPKTKSNTPVVNTVVDLAIARVNIHDGTLHVLDRSVPLNVRGDRLRIELDYDSVAARYQGLVSMAPIYLSSGDRAPPTAQLTIPLILAKNSVRIANARIATPQSQLIINAELWNLSIPDASIEATARVALDELGRSFHLPLHLKQSPDRLEAQALVRIAGHSIDIKKGSARLGSSSIEASGNLDSGAQFRASLDLHEMSRLFALPENPGGVVNINGSAKEPYDISGDIDTTPVSLTFQQSRFRGIRAVSAFHADPQEIELRNLHLYALGGEMAGDVRLLHDSNLSAALDLRNFDIQKLTRELANREINYAGVVSGRLEAGADVNRIQSSLVSHADLAIAPRNSGIPVSGSLNLTYNGDREAISLDNSRIHLPHSTISLSGVAGELAELSISSRNLSDFASLPVTLHNGSADIRVYARGPLRQPQISGSVQMTNFQAGNTKLDRLTASFNASPSRVSVQHGVLHGPNVEAQFTGFIGLRDWRPAENSAVSADGYIHNGDLADILAIAGEQRLQATGSVNASVNLAGTVASPTGAAQLSITNGSVLQTPFHQIQANVDFTQQQAVLRKLQITAPAGEIDASGLYSHGEIQASVTASDVSLARFGVVGTARVNGNFVAKLQASSFALKQVNFRISAQTQQYGDVTAQATTSGNSVLTHVDSNFGGASLRVAAETRLVSDYPTTGELSFAHLELQKVVPSNATGSLSGSASFSGTVQNPEIRAKLSLVRASIYDQPVNSVEASVAYSRASLKLESLRASTPAGNLDAHGTYSHSPTDLRQGRGEIWVSTNGIDLSRVAILRKREPGLSGIFRIDGDVALDVGPHLLPVRADVTGGLAHVAWNGAELGNVSFKSETNGNAVAMSIDSNLAKSTVHGNVEIALGDEYMTKGRLTFEHLTAAALLPFVPGVPSDLDAEMDGQVSGTVALTDLANAQAAARVSHFRVTAQKVMKFENQGPILILLDHSVVRVESAHITGPSTDIQVKGTAALNETVPLDLTASATMNMKAVQLFYPNAYTEGSIDASAAIHGSLLRPVANGEIRLKDVTLQLSSWPNGISNANGVIQLSGNSARITSLTGESGGGKITAAGFIGYTGTALDFDLRANARDVRVRSSGASVSFNAAVTLSGTSRRSMLGGTATITRVGYSQQSDIGSILTAYSTPPQVPATPTGILGAMRLNVRIQTAPDVIFQTSLAQQLSASADVTLEGTAASPGMVGRANITGGTLVFFGNKYTVNRGSISFYNPNSIDPVLDIDLETTAQGVQVDIGVSGPIENLKLTYRSDPPLKFQDIIALLAAGKTPPDPTIAVNQPYAPDQTATQMGESAVLGAAVANPVATRLARVFGVSELSIAPTFVTGSALPQTRITVTQQINSAITLTLSQDLSQANAELVRIEWSLTPKFSAVATRDENGIFGVDFYYRRQFK